MPGPLRSDALDADPAVDDGSGDPGVDYLEAIALLQDEVARLEQELRWRDERPSDANSLGAAPTRDDADSAAGSADAAGARAEVERLELELAGRDETIGLLLDQLSRAEEAHAAGRAEWEHVAGWLAELEQRVEGQDGDALRRLEERLAAREQEVQELRKKAEQERRAGEAQRRVSAAEIARLQAALGRVQAAPAAAAGDGEAGDPRPGPDDEVVDALRSENLRLRAALEESTKRLEAGPSEARDARWAEMLKERDDLIRQLERVEDERRRDRHEHTAALVELQAQLSRASLARQDEEAPRADEGLEKAARDRDVDLRIRALREHLLEIHEQEAEARKQKQLFARLSRLWNRTGPR
jgi:uncharacterized small protein (DUF1192 family)